MSEQTLFKVTVDNITIEVPAGTTILQAARQIGGTVAPPAMCYYSKLKGSGGKCRTCLVEVSTTTFQLTIITHRWWCNCTPSDVLL